jgi:hypothetical protein
VTRVASHSACITRGTTRASYYCNCGQQHEAQWERQAARVGGTTDGGERGVLLDITLASHSPARQMQGVAPSIWPNIAPTSRYTYHNELHLSIMHTPCHIRRVYHTVTRDTRSKLTSSGPGLRDRGMGRYGTATEGRSRGAVTLDPRHELRLILHLCKLRRLSVPPDPRGGRSTAYAKVRSHAIPRRECISKYQRGGGGRVSRLAWYPSSHRTASRVRFLRGGARFRRASCCNWLKPAPARPRFGRVPPVPYFPCLGAQGVASYGTP